VSSKKGSEWVIVNTHGESFRRAQKGITLKRHKKARGAHAMRNAGDVSDAALSPCDKTVAF